jgi:hypothetical protein
MGGGAIELTALGAQDAHITGNPQITYFKAVYKRHTNFYKNCIKIKKDGGDSIGFGNEYKFKLGNGGGHLLGKLYFEVVVSGLSTAFDKYTVNHFGNSLIKKVKLEIGGREIDTLYSQWLQIYKELIDKTTFDNYHEANTNENYGGDGLAFFPTNGSDNSINRTVLNINKRVDGDAPLVFGGTSIYGTKAANKTYYKKMYIPLRFFFNNTIGLVLPLCALYNHEVILTVNLETKANLIGTVDTLTLKTLDLYGDYYYLEKDETNRYIHNNLTYLIETVQKEGPHFLSGTQSNSNYTDSYADPSNDALESKPKEDIFLNSFSHPVKYMAWVVTNPNTGAGLGPCYFMSQCSSSEYGNDGVHGHLTLKLNGEDKITNKPMSYFTRLLPTEYCHKPIPKLDRIGMYSFGINPFEYHPSGTCNFSKLTKFEFNPVFGNDALSSNNTIINGKDLYIFAVNYNILNINNGMGGLLYT